MPCSVYYYMDFCYRIIVEKYEALLHSNSILIIHFFCSTHFLKNVISKTKKCNETIKTTFAFRFSFTVLQNSRTLGEFEENLFHVYTIFNVEHMNPQVSTSINFMKDKIRESGCSIDGSDTHQQQQHKNSTFNEYSSLDNTEMNIFYSTNYKTNRFRKYLDDFILKINIHRTLSNVVMCRYE
jgi:hypothetical protein